MDKGFLVLSLWILVDTILKTLAVDRVKQMAIPLAYPATLTLMLVSLHMPLLRDLVLADLLMAGTIAILSSNEDLLWTITGFCGAHTESK
jgi:hypothetical protein